jgi:hypothetical protein
LLVVHEYRSENEDIKDRWVVGESVKIGLWIYTPKSTFRFLRVLADSLAEPDRSGQLVPDQPPVPKRRRRPAAPVPDGYAGDPEPVDPPAVSVGENPLPEHKGGEGE